MDPNDILALIKKRGWSLNQLALDAGVSKTLVSLSLRKPNPTGERIIIDFLQIGGHGLWPDRYAKNGTRIVPDLRGPRRGLRIPDRAA